MKAFIFFALSFVIFSSYANEISWIKSNKAGDHYLVAIQGENSWFLDGFWIPNGKLQEKLFSRPFRDLQTLKQIVKKEYPDFHLKSSFHISWRHTYQTTEVSGASLWEVKYAWSNHWENEFSDWVNKNFHTDYFVENKLATDCADVAFALRWVFARNNNLPALNTLAGSGVKFSQDSLKQEWLKLPRHNDWNKDKRFLAALRFLLNNSYTHTLEQDTYPVQLTKEAVREGTILLSIGNSTGHTQLISKARYNSDSEVPITLLSSTVPADVRSLFEEPLIFTSNPVPGEFAFKRFRWPQKNKFNSQLMEEKAHPWFSEDQFSESFIGQEKNFVLALYKKLAPNFEPKTAIIKGVDSLINDFNLRKQVVDRGLEFCKNNNCSPNTVNWENWSTPSRDKRIKQKILSVIELVNQLSVIDSSVKSIWEQALDNQTLDVSSDQQDLREIIDIWKYNLYSSDPRVNLDQRWGNGPKAIAVNVKSLFDELTIIRNKRINTNTCNKTCQTGDKNWANSNSYTEDYPLFELFEGINIFKSSFENSELATFNNVLNGEKLKIGSTELNYNQWLDAIPWFNADPRVSKGVRWGEARYTKKYQYFSDLENFFVYKSGYAVVNNKKVINLMDGSEWRPENESRFFYHQSSPYIFGFANSNETTVVQVFDTKGKLTEKLLIKEKIKIPKATEVIFHSMNLISLKGANNTRIFINVKNQNKKLILNIKVKNGYFLNLNSPFPGSLNPYAIFYYKDSSLKEKVTLFDGSKGDAIFHEIKDEKDLGLYKVFLLREGYFAILKYSENGSVVTHINIFNVKKGKNEGKLKENVSIEAVLSDNILLIRDLAAYKLVKIDNSFNIKTIYEFKGQVFSSFRNGYHYFSTWSGGKRFYVRSKGEIIEPYQIKKKNHQIVFTSGDLVLSLTKQEPTLKFEISNFDQTLGSDLPDNYHLNFANPFSWLKWDGFASSNNHWVQIFQNVIQGAEITSKFRAVHKLSDKLKVEAPLMTPPKLKMQIIRANSHEDGPKISYVKRGVLINLMGRSFIWLDE